jgi:outer membrane usher protein
MASATPTVDEADADESKVIVGSEATTDEIFQAMFGRAAHAEVVLPYPVIISGLNQGDVEMTRSLEPGGTEIDRDSIVNLLVPFLIEEKQEELLVYKSSQETVTTAELQAFGLSAEFDHGVLILIIDIPLDIRSVIPLAMQRRRDPSLGLDMVEQAKSSAIVNVAAGTTYVHESDALDRGFNATAVNVEGAVNYKGYVFESGFRYSDFGESDVVRNDTRLTKDFVERMVRVQAGDIQPPSTGLQGNPTLLGVAGFRNFGLRPYEEYRTNPTQQFELQRAASVAIYINGQFLRELRLRPGRYALSDLPLRSAAGNDVVLEIEYDSGDTDRVIFSAFYDFNLLQKGVTDFSFSVGPVSRLKDGGRDYDFDDVAISGFYRKGWTDRLTAGVSVQASSDLANVGAESFYTTNLGTFSLLAHYSSADGKSGSALTGQYQWTDADPKRNAQFNLLASYADDSYRTLGRGQSNFRYSLAARASANLSEDLRMQLFAGWEERYGTGSPTSSNIGASLNWSTRFGVWGANIRREDRDGDSELTVGINFTRRLGEGFLQLGHDTRNDATRASYSSRQERGVGTLGWRGAYQRQSGMDEVRAGLEYTGNRFEARAEQRITTTDPDRSFGSENYTELSIGSALVWADGRFAVTRPVFDSFVIIAKNEGAGEFELAADPQGSIFSTDRKYMAVSSDLGPAVVPDLNSYYVRTIEVDAPEAPPGVSLGGQALHFQPGYRGGFVVDVGDDRNVAVMTVLVDSAGVPVEYAAGYAIIDDDRKPIFTNAGGRLYIDGLKHGERIRIEFDSPAGLVAYLTVPDGEIGIIRLETPVQLYPVNPDGRDQMIADQRKTEIVNDTL